MAHGAPSVHLSRLVRRGLVSEADVTIGRLYGRFLHPHPRGVEGNSIRTLDLTQEQGGLRYHAVAHNGLLVQLTSRNAVHHDNGSASADSHYMLRVSRPGDKNWAPKAVYTRIPMSDDRVGRLAVLSSACEALGAVDPLDVKAAHARLADFDRASPDGYLVESPGSLGPVARTHGLHPVPGRFVAVDKGSRSAIVWLMDSTGKHPVEVAEARTVLEAYGDALASYMGLRRLPVFIEQQAKMLGG